jgi:hypothetical protein
LPSACRADRCGTLPSQHAHRTMPCWNEFDRQHTRNILVFNESLVIELIS